MSKLSDLVAVPPKKFERTCSFFTWKETLSEEDRAAVDILVHDDRWSVPQIATHFIEAGCPIGVSRLRDHRHGRCVKCSGR